MASIAIMVPVPLSVAPDEPSHESKCAESITYSFGFSLPLIIAMVLNTGCSPSSCASRSSRTIGFCLFSARRKTSP